MVILFILFLASSFAFEQSVEQRPMVPLEEEEKAVSIAIAIMLFGGIAFQMSLFYLVNHPDAHMKRYSWQAISDTISIFCSVLIFKGLDEIVDWMLEDSTSHALKVAADFSNFFLWLLILQAIIYHRAYDAGDAEVHTNIKAAAILLGNIVGFASINAWGAIQQLPFFSASPLRAFSAVFVALGGLLTIALFTKNWRSLCFGCTASPQSNSEAENETQWSEEVEKAEDDVFGLTGSFLIVQAVRFAITNELPNQDGIQNTEPSHYQSLLLLSFGVLSNSIVIFLGQKYSKIVQSEKGTNQGRCISVFHTLPSFCFAWSLLLTIRAEVLKLHIANLANGVMGTVILALIVSALAFCWTRFFDKIVDECKDSKVIIKGAQNTILAFGVVVGFAWELCFEAGIETISKELLRKGALQHLSRLVMALLLAMVILPAWKWYILKALEDPPRKESSPCCSPSGGACESPHETTPLNHKPRLHA